MVQAAHGDTVKVHYRGTLQDGSEFDSSRDREPITVTIGGGQFIQAFEQALLGMVAGDQKTVTIESGDAFGERRSDLIQEVNRSQIPPDVQLEVDGALFVRGPGGEPIRLTVTSLSEETVTLDANHPLAGKDLTFEIELVEIV